MKIYRVILAVMFLLVMPATAIAQESTPEPATHSSAVSGTAFDLIGPGEPDTVSIVAYSTPNDRTDTIGVIVRNNTDDVVSGIEVKAEIRDANGKLVAVADISEFRGGDIQPGEIGIGLVMGAGVNDPTLTISFKLKFDHGPGSDFMGKTGLDFVYSEWTGDRILGEFRNPSKNTLENVYLSYACFDEQGTLMGVEWGSAHGVLAPDETTSFQVGDYDPKMASCANFLITGHGYEQ